MLVLSVWNFIIFEKRHIKYKQQRFGREITVTTVIVRINCSRSCKNYHSTEDIMFYWMKSICYWSTDILFGMITLFHSELCFYMLFSRFIYFLLKKEIKFIWFQPHHDWKHTTLVNCSILLFWLFIHLLKTVSICNDSFVLRRYLRWSLYIYDQFVCWQILITHATYYLFLNLDKCRHIIHIKNTIKHNTVVVWNPWVYLRFY